MQDYRKLEVHSRAHANAIAVRNATKAFPRTGFTDFKTQLTKAAESIPFNIVEGCGADSSLEFGAISPDQHQIGVRARVSALPGEGL